MSPGLVVTKLIFKIKDENLNGLRWSIGHPVNNNDWRLDLNDAMNPVLAFIE